MMDCDSCPLRLSCHRYDEHCYVDDDKCPLYLAINPFFEKHNYDVLMEDEV